MTEASRWYDQNADELLRLYEGVRADAVHSWLTPALPALPATALDIGCGSGRDAAWLAELGLEVVAVEPSSRLLAEAQRLHPSSSIRWLPDSLPSLENVLRLGLSFDIILLSAVWMHVAPTDRTRAFRKLATLLKPGGSIALTLRNGPSEAERGFHETSLSEIEHLARAHGAYVERFARSEDRLGRPDVSWEQIIVRLPDDGTGALPLLRHVILNDDKSSTYKLALLRVLCRIADGAAGYARHVDDGYVSVPLGLVALYWVRLFKPLLAARLPQSPTNVGTEKLGFVKAGFRELEGVSHLDLRIGTTFGAERSKAIHAALRDASETIARMPAHYMTYPDGAPVLPVRRKARASSSTTVLINEQYLRGLWRTAHSSAPLAGFATI
jgi:SAM-dependent methyltransferase